MKSEPEKRTWSPRSPFPGQRMDVTKTDNISDERLKIEREKLLSLCRDHNLPEPRLQVIGALSKSAPENSHFISTLVVGQTKFSSYPELYTSENTAKFAALSRAVEFIERLKPQGEVPETNSKSNSKVNLGTTRNLSATVIHPAQTGDADMAQVMQDIYSENFNADQISEAELYGDVSAEASYVYENGFATECTEAYEVPEAMQSEYQEAYAEHVCMEYGTENGTIAAQNGEVYEVAEQADGGEQAYYNAEYSTEDPNLYANVTEVYEDSGIDETCQPFTAQLTQDESYLEDQPAQYSEDQLAQYSEEQLAQYSEEQLAQYSEEHLGQYSEEQLAQHSEEQLAQYSEEQLAQYSEEQHVQYSEEQLAQYSEEQLAQYSEEQLARYSEEELAQYSEEQLAQYSEEQLAQYSEEQLAQYSEEQLAQYSEEQLAQYSEEQLAKYSGEQLAQYPENAYAECTGEQVAEVPHADYSEEQYAQYAQLADEQGLDPSADPSQYYAEANAQVVAEDYSELDGVTEAAPEQVMTEAGECAEEQIEYDTAAQYDEAMYASEIFADPDQAALYGSEEVPEVDPAPQVYYESDPLATQQMYYDGTCCADGAYAEIEKNEAEAAAQLGPELTAQISSETVVSVDSAFYDETLSSPYNLQAGEEMIYETGGASTPDAYYGLENGYDADAAAYDDGTGIVQEGYAVEEQPLVDGMAAMTLQPAVEDHAVPDYQAAAGLEVEYVTEYYEGESTQGGTQVNQHTTTLLPEEVDIYQLEQLPADAATVGDAAEIAAAASTQQEVPVGEYAETEYMDQQYSIEHADQGLSLAEIDIYQVEELPTLRGEVDDAAPEACASHPEYSETYTPETDLYSDPAQMQFDPQASEEVYQSTPVETMDITHVDDVAGAEATIDGTAPETIDTQAPGGEYVTDESDNSGLTGSLESRLQRALIVNISFDGHVTLNLYGPMFEAFAALEYKHKAEPVSACEPNQWYAVDYDCTDGSNTKRAVAQYPLEDGQSYMMHFLDEDYLSAVPLSSIFELENLGEVSSIPPQGVTVEVMELTEKKVSPHTVEILLSQWLYKDVYVIPVDITTTTPKVRLINGLGDLLNV